MNWIRQKVLLLYIVSLGIYLIVMGVAIFNYDSQMAKDVNLVVFFLHVIFLVIYNLKVLKKLKK